MKKIFIKIIIMYIFSAISFLIAMHEPSNTNTIPLEKIFSKKEVEVF